MQSFTYLSDSDIKDILAYVEQDPTDFEKSSGTVDEVTLASDDSSSLSSSKELDCHYNNYYCYFEWGINIFNIHKQCP